MKPVVEAGFVEGDLLADRYTIERELGRGGMATVYVAQDARHRRRVAIKVMHRELSRAVGTQRFLREIEIAARLQHPHILPLFDSGERDGLLFYVMPFIDGNSLRDHMNREHQLSIPVAIRIAGEVARALAYAHERGVVHRDVKPENILLSNGGAIVADFGVAQVFVDGVDESLTSSGFALGTPTYISPEQGTADSVVDGRTDIYALGAVLYEMLAGIPPFVGPNVMSLLAQKMTSDPRPLRLLRQHVPANVDRAITVAMARMPADRFRTCEEFAVALEKSEPNHDLSFAIARATRNSDREPTGPTGGANLGPLVSRMCDRWSQVNSFEAAFREGQQRFPGRPMFHVVHGQEGESHDSFVERLIATRLKQFATELGGQERGTVKVFRVPWPESDSLSRRQRDMTISLFREVASGYMGNDLTAEVLSHQESLAPILFT